MMDRAIKITATATKSRVELDDILNVFGPSLNDHPVTVRKRRTAQPLRFGLLLSWICHHSSSLAVCGPSVMTNLSPSCARKLTAPEIPGLARTFSPAGPTPTTCTDTPMAKLPG